MEKYIEVILNLLPLLDTIGEGILYSKKQIQELRYEEAKELLEDMVTGIVSIEDAIQPMLQYLPQNKIVALETKLKDDISKVVSSYENGKEVGLNKFIEERLLVDFNSWKEELERILRPYVVS